MLYVCIYVCIYGAFKKLSKAKKIVSSGYVDVVSMKCRLQTGTHYRIPRPTPATTDVEITAHIYLQNEFDS